MAASSIIPIKSINPTTLREVLIAEFGSKAKKPLKITDDQLTQLLKEADDLKHDSSVARIQSKEKARAARLRTILACPKISAIREKHKKNGTTEDWYETMPFGRKKGMVNLLASIGDELREAAAGTRQPMFTAVNMDLLHGSLKSINAALREVNGKKNETRVSKPRNLKGIKSRVEQIVALVEPIPDERPRVAVKTLKALGLNPRGADGIVEPGLWRKVQQLMLSCLARLPEADQERAARTLTQAAAEVVQALMPDPCHLREPNTLSEIVGNEDAVGRLTALLNQGGTPAILITGKSRSGKTQMAKAFAREWAKLHNQSLSSVPFELVGAGQGSKAAARKIRVWAEQNGFIQNPVLIVNEVEELLVEQRQLLDLLENGGADLPAPLILCTTKTEGDMHRTRKDILALDPQLLGRMTLKLHTEALGDDVVEERVRIIAKDEGHQLTAEDVAWIVEKAEGRLGIAIQALDFVLTGPGRNGARDQFNPEGELDTLAADSTGVADEAVVEETVAEVVDPKPDADAAK